MIKATYFGLIISAAVALFNLTERTSLDTALKAALLFAIGFVAGALYVIDKTSFEKGN